MNTNEILKLVALNTFRKFEKADWYTYGGIKDSDPLICDTDDYTLIVADGLVSYINADGDETLVQFGDAQ